MTVPQPQSRAAPPAPRRPRLERALLTAATVAYFVGGYLATSRLPPIAPLRTLRTPLDDAIPFWPFSVLVYSSVYTAALFPLFVVRCPRLFRRTAAAYFLVLTASFACYFAFPATAAGFRPDAARLDRRAFAEWALATTYDLDPPCNLFPSLHIGIAATAALAAWRARRRVGLCAFAWVLAIAASTWTVKQHFVADAAGALALAGIAYAVALRPYDPRATPRAGRAYGPAGVLGYLALTAAMYAVGWAVFATR